MNVSIIITAKKNNPCLQENIAKCRELDCADFDIYVLPDEDDGKLTFEGPPLVKIIPTGKVSPAEKRDRAAQLAKAEILAFLDDDAYPEREWLKNALLHFAEKQVAAVGGPAVTALNDSFLQRAGGEVYASVIVSAGARYRYLPGKLGQSDDLPSCNLIVRRSDFEQAGGFNTKFWPGEDSKLCLDITKRLKKEIIYDPKIMVYHHRRPLFGPHLKQVAGYASRRGLFVKKFPETSRRLAYFLPSIFVIGLIAGTIAALFFAGLRNLYVIALTFYLTIALLFSLRKDLRLTPFIFLGTIATHIVYGVFFLKGLFSEE